MGRSYVCQLLHLQSPVRRRKSGRRWYEAFLDDSITMAKEEEETELDLNGSGAWPGKFDSI